VVSLDDADVVSMDVLPEVIELFELTRHASIASDQTMPQQVLVNSRVGEVTSQRFVVQRVVAQCRRILV